VIIVDKFLGMKGLDVIRKLKYYILSKKNNIVPVIRKSKYYILSKKNNIVPVIRKLK
jgi:hypothetical protein